MTISERNTLAGSPSNRLIRSVRQSLRLYMRCRPQRDDSVWRQTWEWAAAIARRDSLQGLVPKAKPMRWPSSSEIASQFVFLCLIEMRSSSALKLPFRAVEKMPAAVQQRLAGLKVSAGQLLPAIEYSGSAPTNRGGTS